MRSTSSQLLATSLLGFGLIGLGLMALVQPELESGSPPPTLVDQLSAGSASAVKTLAGDGTPSPPSEGNAGEAPKRTRLRLPEDLTAAVSTATSAGQQGHQAASHAQELQSCWNSAPPVMLINILIKDVKAPNVKQGLQDRLNAKLDAAVQALGEINNNVAAVSSLQAFINAVQAHAGKEIPQSDANEFIASAQEIITLLQG